MPESPDFEQIARDLYFCAECESDAEIAEGEQRIVEQLRLIWNARGAADIAKLDVVIASYFGLSLKAKDMERALRELDR